MPLSLTRAATNAALWATCASRLLDELGDRRGPDDFPSHLWIAHRAQRDSVYRLAAGRGLPGWLGPPVSFLSELRDRFEIRTRPLGILTGRLLVARLARERARDHDLQRAPAGEGPVRSHMLDSVFSELLPEGVDPDSLRAALADLEGDGFSRRRNDWVADTYEAFLGELASLDRYDPRSIHALVAERVEAGALRAAIGGATRLHVYGITSLRGRRRLVRALASQNEVDVVVYLPREDEPSEWDELGAVPLPPEGETAERREAPPVVQPAPDALREAAWIARRVKRLLADGVAEPHEIAVVARSGRRDTRLVHSALEEAGVPATARLRTPLAEVPCLRALLSLFRAEAASWDYGSLRSVLTSPYFGIRVDLRAVDYLARMRRVAGLETWVAALARLRKGLESDEGRHHLQAAGIFADRLDEDVSRLRSLQEQVADLAEARGEREWIDLTLELLDGGRFGLRRRLCRPVGERFDVVRLDQRGVLALEALLREWQLLVASEQPFGATEWHTRLRRLLEANEIALSTPLLAGVQVLEAHEAALTPFLHTFVVHANDGIFPRAAGQGGVFSDSERRRLQELGLPLSDREGALRRERSLWRAVTQGDRVTVTYRTTDANGIPRLPSLMVPEHDATTELPRTLDSAVDADGRPGAIEPVSAAQLSRVEAHRLAALRRARDDAPFPASDPDRLRHAVLSAFVEELRTGGLDEVIKHRSDLAPAGPDAGPASSAGRAAGHVSPASVFGVERPISERPHPWNGELRDPVVLEHLAERFGEERVWSASQLQSYALRPFDFFLQRVLRIEEPEEAEEETSPLEFGKVAHAILERFYGGLSSELPATVDEATEERLERAMREVFARFEADADEWLGVPPLWAVTRERLRETLRRFVARDLRLLARHRRAPALVELAFGGLESTPPVELRGEDVQGRPARLRLRGRIDRVERGGSGDDAWLHVVDYKSGQTPSPAGYSDGSLLQTALYMLALERLGHTPVRSGAFRSIRLATWDGAPLRREACDDVLRFALSIPRRVRAGLFEAVQARATKVAGWQPGLGLTRSQARISGGSRFDLVYGETVSSDG